MPSKVPQDQWSNQQTLSNGAAGHLSNGSARPNGSHPSNGADRSGRSLRSNGAPHSDGAGAEYSSERIRDLLHRKALATERHRAGVARRLGLSDTEVTALAHLARHGSLTPSRLGDLLFLTSGGVTALTRRLERGGYVRREPHPRDKRSTVISAEPSILEAAEELFAPLVAALDGASAALTDEQRLLVGRYLEHVVALSEQQADAVAREPDELDASRELAGAPAPGLWT